MKLQPNETELTGRWVSKNSGVIEDVTCQRITWLLANVLKKVATDASGWEELHVDQTDGRYWELSYPQSELQGGGPPRLVVIGEDVAKKKYNLN